MSSGEWTRSRYWDYAGHLWYLWRSQANGEVQIAHSLGCGSCLGGMGGAKLVEAAGRPLLEAVQVFRAAGYAGLGLVEFLTRLGLGAEVGSNLYG